jgi:hypothetical protein
MKKGGRNDRDQGMVLRQDSLKLATGQIVKPTFVTPMRIDSELRDSGKGYWVDEDVIILGKVSIGSNTNVLPTLDKGWSLQSHADYHSIQWDE